ncbi:MAG: beta strand repeat-containing protein [Candidatus Saccharimonadales bacterium]
MRFIKHRTLLRLISLVLFAMLLTYPATTVFAAETTTTTTPAKTTGPTRPNGADGNTYVYNKVTGLWENDHYTWDPATGQTAPKDSTNYSYNPDTKMWDTTKWQYDAPSGQYKPNIISTSQSPDGGGTQTTNTSRPAADSSPSSASNSSVKANSKSSDIYNLFYNAKISNTVDSTATSGDALVAQNTIAGSALSGNAQAMATIINMLQSSWAPAGSGQVATFINNINGNVYGDLSIDPGQIPSSISSANPANSNLKVNVQTAGQINNQINLAANSGNSTVDSNTSAGNATTGTAQAIANVINMINSTIASGKSFVGMININGSLNGDILMPADMISQLLASNSVPRTTINTSDITNNALLANYTNNDSISNQVNTDAKSGSANVVHNTTAGNATSGNASSNITVLNLTGQQIIGKDALLVFVNVQGKWIGMIVNAPAGSTSAVLGGGINSDTVASNTTLNGSSDLQINNDIRASARSGDATISDNTLAGNATSGNATTSVNLANLLNSSLALSNWFGVLFINITGNWIGSFGINTAAGNAPASHNRVNGSVSVFRFTPTSHIGSNVATQSYSSDSSYPPISNTAVLASSVHNGLAATYNPYNQNGGGQTTKNGLSGAWTVSAISGLLGISLLGTDKLTNRRKK